MSQNDFLPFCPTDTGTNLLTEADYLSATDRVSGNKPGVASSKLNNKAIRQANAIASAFAQFLANSTGTDVLDDAVSAKLLAQITGQLTAYQPIYTKYTSGSGSHNLTYIFQIASGSATIGATYTNNAVTFTVVATVSGATVVKMSGSGAPLVSGTLTKASGTGDATLTFYSVRAPKSLFVKMSAGGGAGGGSGSTLGSAGTDGGTTSFGTSLLSCTGGVAGGNSGSIGTGGAGGVGSITLPAYGNSGTGNAGNGGGGNTLGSPPGIFFPGGAGGPGFFGGSGSSGNGGNIGGDAIVNSGGGGGGAGSGNTAGNSSGLGGGGGGWLTALVPDPTGAYAFLVGAKGNKGGAGSGGFAGGDGSSGQIEIWANY